MTSQRTDRNPAARQDSTRDEVFTLTPISKDSRQSAFVSDCAPPAESAIRPRAPQREDHTERAAEGLIETKNE